MLSIGNKDYRNLQEQVGYNTAQIDKIFEFLDGINISDNVILVPDMSYILSTEELGIINREVAFIVYDGKLYIKRGADNNYAYFDVVFSVTGGTVISFNSSEIQVTLSNGALGIINVSAQTYSITQIDSFLNLKANLSYVNEQLALKANADNIPFERIKDANGHDRFAEGSVNFYSSVPAGVTKTFGKWSLSGTHLMIVIAGVIPNGTVIPFSSLATCENVPQWIINKLYPMYTNVLARGVFEIWNDDASSQQMECYLVKTTSLAISTAGVTATKDRQFRITFDLLVDNA